MHCLERTECNFSEGDGSLDYLSDIFVQGASRVVDVFFSGDQYYTQICRLAYAGSSVTTETIAMLSGGRGPYWHRSVEGLSILENESSVFSEKNNTQFMTSDGNLYEILSVPTKRLEEGLCYMTNADYYLQGMSVGKLLSQRFLKPVIDSYIGQCGELKKSWGQDEGQNGMRTKIHIDMSIFAPQLKEFFPERVIADVQIVYVDKFEHPFMEATAMYVSDQLEIQVSDHFMKMEANDQLSVIAHELGHHYYADYGITIYDELESQMLILQENERYGSTYVAECARLAYFQLQKDLLGQSLHLSPFHEFLALTIDKEVSTMYPVSEKREVASNEYLDLNLEIIRNAPNSLTIPLASTVYSNLMNLPFISSSTRKYMISKLKTTFSEEVWQYVVGLSERSSYEIMAARAAGIEWSLGEWSLKSVVQKTLPIKFR